MAGEHSMEGIEFFERARDAEAKLLAVERLPAPGQPNEESLGVAVLLTLDAGRILVSAVPAAKKLHAMHLQDKEDAPSGTVSAVEEEPWWRLIGAPLVRVWAEDAGAALRLQFRNDDDSPRFALLSLDERDPSCLRSALVKGPL